MPRNCFVPGCYSNYRSVYKKEGTVSMFTFPRDPNIRAEWVKKIDRGVHFVPTNSSAVCEKHFKSSDFRIHCLSSGREVDTVLKKKMLFAHAVPSIFPLKTFQTRKGIPDPRPLTASQSVATTTVSAPKITEEFLQEENTTVIFNCETASVLQTQAVEIEMEESSAALDEETQAMASDDENKEEYLIEDGDDGTISYEISSEASSTPVILSTPLPPEFKSDEVSLIEAPAESDDEHVEVNSILNYELFIAKINEYVQKEESLASSQGSKTCIYIVDEEEELLMDKLILEVKNRFALYEESYNDSKYDELKCIIWEEIASALNSNSESLRTKWDYLKSRYFELKKKYEKHFSGNSVVSVNMAEMTLLKKLDFLRQFKVKIDSPDVDHRKPESNSCSTHPPNLNNPQLNSLNVQNKIEIANNSQANTHPSFCFRKGVPVHTNSTSKNILNSSHQINEQPFIPNETDNEKNKVVEKAISDLVEILLKRVSKSDSEAKKIDPFFAALADEVGKYPQHVQKLMKQELFNTVFCTEYLQ